MKYAVVELSGNQFLVSEGDKIEVDRVAWEVGKKHTVNPLLVVTEGKVLIGKPQVKSAKTELRVLEHAKGEKIYVRRFKSKSRYRRKKGYRQPISVLEVLKITSGEQGKKAEKGALASAGTELEGLRLSARVRNILKREGIKTIRDLERLDHKSLLEMKGIGEKAADEIEKALGR